MPKVRIININFSCGEHMRKSKKLRVNSIATRLNAALTRRSFAKTLLIDLVAACLVIATWCFTVENSYGYVYNRKFVAENCDVLYNFYKTIDDVQVYFDNSYNRERSDIDWTLPFNGIYYTFTAAEGYEDSAGTVSEPVFVVDETTSATEGEYLIRVEENEPFLDDEYSSVYSPVYSEVKVDASVVLTLTAVCLIVAILLQTISAIVKSFAGGGLIKKYLRPLDDLAIMAEQLSTETHTATEEQVRASYFSEGVDNQNENSEPSLDASDVAELTDALDEIDDSRKRIEIQAEELGGLEAAINNMLKRLEEGRRKQIRFVDDASHELRTPIAVIQGYANMLDRWGKDDPKVRDEAIEAIKNESEHMKTLLDQLLFLARGEMDRHVLELKPISIDVILCEIIEESQMLDKSHKYEISLASGEALEDDDPDNDVLILADVAMIKQCVRILCDNAKKYTPENGTISIKSSEKVAVDDKGAVKREVCIDVTDTGIGISANELPRIFDRFYRGENARADNSSGSGLGLSIARWIIEQHHGRIEAISSPGIGTKMTIILPEYYIGE